MKNLSSSFKKRDFTTLDQRSGGNQFVKLICKNLTERLLATHSVLIAYDGA